jgi:hypothetical protein
MDAPLWLKKYYGNNVDFLNPELIQEGKKWALVKLQKPASKGYSSIGYVLIQKNGSHEGSKYFSLHEGLPSQEDMSKMIKSLNDIEGWPD